MSLRVGKAVEALLGASIVLVSEGELNVSTSLVDDEGVDLVFNRQGKSNTLAVQVKSRTTDSKRVQQGGMWAQVKDSTFQPRLDLAMMFVIVDPPTARIGPLWFVPSTEFDQLAYHNPTNGSRWIRTRIEEVVADAWAPYRVELRDLPRRIFEAMETARNAP